MDDAQIEFKTNVEVARTALATWQAKPTRENFLTYRDASEIAVKWHRACRLGGAADESIESELDQLLAG